MKRTTQDIIYSKNTEETADTEKIVLEELEKEFGYITNELEIEYIKSGMKEIEERKKRCEAAKPQIEETTEILKELKKGRRKR